MPKCRICKAPTKFRACSIECSIELVKQDKEKRKAKAERLQAKADRIRLKTRREWLAECQSVFNRYIRERDRNELCICCNQPLTLDAVGGGYDCGHYRSVGSAPHIRFDPRNAHGQRKQCNRWGSGRAVDYRLGLIQRIGLAEVEALEADQSPRKYTIDELKLIIAEYRLKLKQIAK